LEKRAMTSAKAHGAQPAPLVVALPGSRRSELSNHLSLMEAALRRLREQRPIRVRYVLPNSAMSDLARALLHPTGDAEIQTGNLAAALRDADLALACSGTVTLECAFFRVPTVVIYRTTRLTYEIGKRIIRVPYIAMPNLLANAPVFPELIQDHAAPERMADELSRLLNPEAQANIRARLDSVITSLGPPGACARAAEAILKMTQSGRFLG
jgi:lipid-A-disaccharide synthase